MGVFFYEDTCSKLCVDILHDLETIDGMRHEAQRILLRSLKLMFVFSFLDEAEDEGIQMVKTTDLTIAEELNVKDFPTLVYYQGGIPSLFKGRVFILIPSTLYRSSVVKVITGKSRWLNWRGRSFAMDAHDSYNCGWSWCEWVLCFLHWGFSAHYTLRTLTSLSSIPH